MTIKIPEDATHVLNAPPHGWSLLYKYHKFIDGLLAFWNDDKNKWVMYTEADTLILRERLEEVKKTPQITKKRVRLKSQLAVQIGGSHYKEKGIQPVAYNSANQLDFLQGSVVKYVTRHKSKNGAEDIKKAVHFLQFILEFQYDVRSEIKYDEADK